MAHPPPTIAHVLHRLYLAGAEVLAADLARKLSDRYRFVFLCLDEIGPLGRQLASEGFEVIDLKRKPGVDLAVARRIRRITRKHKIDLFHSHQYTPFFYTALSRGLSSKPPLLFTEHGRHYPDHRRLKRVIVNPWLLRRSDRVTAVGRFVKQALIDHECIKAKRIEVIHNGIDPSEFACNHAAETRAEVRAELGIDPGQPAILQVARFHSVKDHATAIRAMAHVTQQATHAPLLLMVGDGPQRAEMETLSKSLGIESSTRFLGVRSDIPRLMAGADIFILSSLSEGISVTLLEAMGAALPIVATDVGGNSEIVTHETTGLLSPRGDAQGLAQNIATLLSDPDLRRRFGQAGRERLLKHFTQQQMHDAYARVYDQMLYP